MRGFERAIELARLSSSVQQASIWPSAVNAVRSMKPSFPAVWLLVGLLSALNVGTVLAASGQEKSTASTTVNPAGVGAKKTVSPKNTAAKPKPRPTRKRAPVAAKSKSASELAKTPLVPAHLDLSLPQDMVRHLQPLGALPSLVKREPLLPPLFNEKPKDDSPFQLNGRLLSNEMGLQLRNDERRDVEGAALDFEFKQ